MKQQEDIDNEIENSLGRPLPAHEDPLEELYTETMLNKKLKVKRRDADPALKTALDATAKKLRELYTLPENWERTRGVALIDKTSGVLVGNFSEYIHKKIPSTRKLIREHLPIAINASELVEGYLGERFENSLRDRSFEAEHQATCHVILDEIGVEAPSVKLILRTRLGAVTQARLVEDTQFAAASGEMRLSLPANTDIYFAASIDTKAIMRKEVL